LKLQGVEIAALDLQGKERSRRSYSISAILGGQMEEIQQDCREQSLSLAMTEIAFFKASLE
jgi:hypothetical protein